MEGSTMRLLLGLVLTLVIGLGAAYRPSDNLPGREVGATESSHIIGGLPYCSWMNNVNCSGSGCGSGVGCLPGNYGVCVATGDACTQNCIIWACVTGNCLIEVAPPPL